MKNFFTKHPKKIGESYFMHFIKAFTFGLSLLTISLMAFVHAFFPFFFEYSTSYKIEKLHKKLNDRNSKRKK